MQVDLTNIYAFLRFRNITSSHFKFVIKAGIFLSILYALGSLIDFTTFHGQLWVYSVMIILLYYVVTISTKLLKLDAYLSINIYSGVLSLYFALGFYVFFSSACSMLSPADRLSIYLLNLSVIIIFIVADFFLILIRIHRGHYISVLNKQTKLNFLPISM
ncbi:MAG: hypothetical protein MJ189_04875, partial [Coriobacteriales bacterium]|nr:hypothetical protein [Coriobacteriales bacterium]